MTVDSATGAITWTPAESQLGVYTVTLRAADNGTPAQSATRPFQVTVTGSGTSIAVATLAGNLIQLTIAGDAGNAYELQISPDLITWERLIIITLTQEPYQHIEQMNTPRRFYRLKLIQ
jgi:hypothetical protein